MKPDFYTWPNPAFPFRLYYESNDLRVFIIENIFHNYNWLNQVKENIRPTDYFISLTGWYIDEYFAKTNARCLEMLGLNPEQFIILFNTMEEKLISEKYGMSGEIVNNNCWLDYNIFNITPVKKQYDAVYVARPSEAKRHHLASNIKSLALAAGGNNHGNKKMLLPDCKNDPFELLDRDGINNLINSSKVGLILSETEGACYASSEYLLCGVPVVSTYSNGGRDYWYDEYNSIVCEPTNDSVEHAVQEVISRKVDPQQIRQNKINLMNHNREQFKTKVLYELFKYTNQHEEDIHKLFDDMYIDKLKLSSRIESVEKYFDTPTRTHYDFIEIGTCDFNTLAESSPPGTVGLSVEPVGQYIKSLPVTKNITKIHGAVTHDKTTDSVCVTYIPQAKINELHPDKGWLKGCNCIDGIHPLINKYQLSDHVVKEKVPLYNFKELISKYYIKQVDKIKIDTEGHDHIIMLGVLEYISDLDVDRYPKHIQFEHHPTVCQADADVSHIIKKLIDHGYKAHQEQNDYIFEYDK